MAITELDEKKHLALGKLVTAAASVSDAIDDALRDGAVSDGDANRLRARMRPVTLAVIAIDTETRFGRPTVTVSGILALAREAAKLPCFGNIRKWARYVRQMGARSATPDATMVQLNLAKKLAEVDRHLRSRRIHLDKLPALTESEAELLIKCMRAKASTVIALLQGCTSFPTEQLTSMLRDARRKSGVCSAHPETVEASRHE